jgi:hypothetical protein
MAPELRAALLEAMYSTPSADSKTHLGAIAPIIDAALDTADAEAVKWHRVSATRDALLAAADDFETEGWSTIRNTSNLRISMAEWLRSRANQ